MDTQYLFNYTLLSYPKLSEDGIWITLQNREVQMILSFSLVMLWVSSCVFLGVYRLYFHPLAKFPGPRLAALTHFYEAYHDLFYKGGGQFPFAIKRMHDQYGPIVRINPDELHVHDPEFFDVIYATNKAYDKPVRNEWRFSVPYATSSTANAHQHKVRRAGISPFFSKARALEHSPLIQKIMDSISRHLSTEYAGTGKVVKIQDMWCTLAADTIMDLVFARPKNLHMYPDFRDPFTTPVTAVAECLPDRLQIWLFPPFRPVVEFKMEMQKQIADVLEDRNEEVKQVKVQGGRTVFHDMIASDMPRDQLRPVRLLHESQSLVGAGFETTALILTYASFHIVDNPAVNNRLKEELVSAMPNLEGPILPWVELERLPYLTAVIQEALRVAMGSVERLPRINTSGPWVFDKWVIPAGTPVGMDQYHGRMDSRVFGPDPEVFRPERWLGDPKGPDGEKPFTHYLNTFGKGTRMCIGLNLAYAEIYIGLATLFRRHDLKFYETTKRHVEFHHEIIKAAPWLGSKGVRFTVEKAE